mmetsp:Transcript_15113/g.33331  ORF Transcript_15113/g.33331 Transcript_15113/m.33331 type:complete len:652 (+) Transcript_15113:40-1995(+)|eukprot:CAMPEP_0204448392 /NCGR_PEP_ID=MMETSP0470-20130426/98317_1 /ASSEMBLY_ACC=CAM_ASM_000385 /TAXON_ID=2969 /ORGANISM="Oxyrrhis marina" /LENGTH=651 /DNA_ID=CAMNT_0051448135 /DNA_START=29 /DNA_END=1987 /DNA_ORIENTATION=-
MDQAGAKDHHAHGQSNGVAHAPHHQPYGHRQQMQGPAKRAKEWAKKAVNAVLHPFGGGKKGAARATQVSHVREAFDPDEPRQHLISSLKLPQLTDADVSNLKDHLQQRSKPVEVEEAHWLAWVEGGIFKTITGCAIVCNSILLGMEADVPEGEHVKSYEWMEFVLLVWFTLELVLRLVYAGCSSFFCDPEDWNWNLFDFVIVSIGVMDAWVMPVVMASLSMKKSKGLTSLITLLRTARLLRVLRVARLFKVFRQLNLLIGGVIEASQAVVWITLLSGILVYVNAVVTTKLIGAREPGYFDNMANSFWTLFNVMCQAGLPSGMTIHDQYFSWKLYFGFFIIGSSWTMVNLVTAVLSEHMVSATSSKNMDEQRAEKAAEFEKDRAAFIRLVSDVFKELDTKQQGVIDFADFEMLLEKPSTIEKMARLAGFGVAINKEEIEAFFHILDRDGTGCVSRNEFISGCIRLRGSAEAKHLFMVQWELYQTRKELFRVIKEAGWTIPEHLEEPSLKPNEQQCKPSLLELEAPADPPAEPPPKPQAGSHDEHHSDCPAPGSLRGAIQNRPGDSDEARAQTGPGFVLASGTSPQASVPLPLPLGAPTGPQVTLGHPPRLMQQTMHQSYANGQLRYPGQSSPINGLQQSFVSAAARGLGMQQ